MNHHLPSLQEVLVGEWDAYMPGGWTTLPMASVVIFSADGTYRNSMVGVNQFHWGHWSLAGAGSSYVIHFAIEGAEPRFFVGPLGTQPIQWPTQETWVIVDVQPNTIACQGLQLTRRTPAPPPLPYPSQFPWMRDLEAPTVSHSAPPPPPFVPAQGGFDPEAMQKIRDTNEATARILRETHDRTQEVYDRANQDWSDTLND